MPRSVFCLGMRTGLSSRATGEADRRGQEIFPIAESVIMSWWLMVSQEEMAFSFATVLSSDTVFRGPRVRFVIELAFLTGLGTWYHLTWSCFIDKGLHWSPTLWLISNVGAPYDRWVVENFCRWHELVWYQKSVTWRVNVEEGGTAPWSASVTLTTIYTWHRSLKTFFC